jgi:5-methyltetrahydropteroyltriglutamate--homocysteine methyltransferase
LADDKPSLPPLTTQIVGSYAKPHWLARHQRMRALDGSWWRPEAEVLEEAKEDAARLAIYEQERAGLALVTDGEAQRASYDRDFLAALSGIDAAHTERGERLAVDGPHPRDEAGWEEYTAINQLKPVVRGPIRFVRSVAEKEALFAKRVARRPVKTTVIGPVSLSLQLADKFYGEPDALVLDLAAALNQEMRALQAVAVDVLQIDEPSWHFSPDIAKRIGRQAIARMVEGITVPVIVHVCYGYANVYKAKAPSAVYPEVLALLSDCPIAGISLEYEQPQHQPTILRHCGNKHVVIGLLDLAAEPETPDRVAERLLAALAVVPPERLHPSSDCGMWHLSRERAFAKIAALAEGTRIVRRALGMPDAATAPPGTQRDD